MSVGTPEPRVVRGIRAALAADLAAAQRVAEPGLERAALGIIRARCEAALDCISLGVAAGRILPAPRLRLGPRDPIVRPTPRLVRLGVFPVNGNPIHWGHLIACLDAMAALDLDQVAVVIQGTDRRKRVSAVTEPHRHALAKDVLAALAPLVVYSDIGRGNAFIGEDNLFRLLRLNPAQRILAHYIVGSDHYRRRDDHGAPDTVARLERHLAVRAHGFDPAVHGVRLLVLERGAPAVPLETPLDVAFLRAGVDASSTEVRGGDLYLAPHRVRRYLGSHADYAARVGIPGAAGGDGRQGQRGRRALKAPRGHGGRRSG